MQLPVGTTATTPPARTGPGREVPPRRRHHASDVARPWCAMTPQQLANCRSHTILAELIQGGTALTRPVVTGVAIDRDHAMKVVVQIVYFPPASPDDYVIPVREKPIPASADRGSAIKTCLMEAAPGPTELPMPLRRLFKRAGYAYCKHSRDAVNDLIDAGLLVKDKRGVRRTGIQPPSTESKTPR